MSIKKIISSANQDSYTALNTDKEIITVKTNSYSGAIDGAEDFENQVFVKGSGVTSEITLGQVGDVVKVTGSDFSGVINTNEGLDRVVVSGKRFSGSINTGVDGDVVEMEITGLGKLVNTIKATETSHSLLALKKNMQTS